MVKAELQKLLDKVNTFYTKRTEQGVTWGTVEGHYWLEVHLDHNRRVPDTKWHPDLIDFKMRVRSNLEGIMKQAEVSKRGRGLLLRDLQRMCDEEPLNEGGDTDNNDFDQAKVADEAQLQEKIDSQVDKNAELIRKLSKNIKV